MLETIGGTLSVSGICRTNKQRSSVCTNNEKKGFLKNYKNAASKNAASRNLMWHVSYLHIIDQLYIIMAKNEFKETGQCKNAHNPYNICTR